MERPRVSVVMSVRNGACRLADTIESVLSQSGVTTEFIVVNDGSSDETATILDAYEKRDRRIRVFHRQHEGLTRALIFGCSTAKGEFIARQDCGDLSLPNRLARQAEFLAKSPDLVMVAVGARFVGPRNETLYEVTQRSTELQQGLARMSLQSISGPSHHGATMFRKIAYDAVGGYRGAFNVAQDLDLWLRLTEIGQCGSICEVLYEAELLLGSISQLRRDEQLQATQVILDCAALRREGANEEPRISAWLKNRARQAGLPSNAKYKNEARYHRFLGNMLRKRDPVQAREYYMQSLRSCLWQPKVWLRLLTLDLLR